jgi:glucokinase
MSLPPAVVLGLDYGGTKIAAAVCDLAGRQLAAAVVTSGGELGARTSFDRGIRAGRDLLDARAPGATLAAVGVSTFGIPFDDRVELAPVIAGWDELPMGALLHAAFPGVPVRMATDAKAAACAEARWGSLAGADPAIYLNLGTGLAAAIVVGGQVVGGSDGASGEIGYNLRSPADVGLPLGRRTPLEDVVSGRALAQLAAPRDAAEVFGAAGDDAHLQKLVADFADELAFHLVNLVIAVNPARVAVGGGMARSFDQIRPRLATALSSGAPYPPELVIARFPQDAPLLGAVSLAVDAATADQRAAPAAMAPVGAQPGSGAESVSSNAGIAV